MTTTADTRLHAAEQLLGQVHEDAAAVAAHAEAALLKADDDAYALRAVLLRAWGLAVRHFEPIDRSITLLRDALAAANAAERADLACGAQLSLSGSLAIGGRTDEALAALDAAQGATDDAAINAQIESQRATVLARTGQHDRADAAYTTALEILEARSDDEGIAVTLANRGYLRLFTGRVDEADVDLRASLSLREDRGELLPAAFVRHNLGHVALYRGQLASALELFIESEREITAITGGAHETQVSRGEALMSAGLFDEAYALAVSIARQMADAGLQLDQAEAQLLAAEAALAAGRTVEAAGAAREASEQFLAQRRPAWADRARLVALQADAAVPSQGRRDEARALASSLEAAGQAVASARAHTVAVELSIGLGDYDTASTDIARLDRFRRNGPIEVRLAAWHARALGQRAGGRPDLALRSLTAALRLARRHQASLRASDLRAAVARHTQQLAAMGCDLLVERGDPAALADWTESYRAASLRLAPVDADPAAAPTGHFAELRALSKRLDDEPDRATTKLLRRRARLVRELQDESRSFGHDRAVVAEPVTMSAVQAALGGDPSTGSHDQRARSSDQQRRRTTMVQYVETGSGQLVAVVLSESCSQLISLGDPAPIHVAQRQLAHALDDLAAGRHVERSVEVAVKARDVLDCHLGTGLMLDEPDGAPADRVVIVPPPRLFALPWSLLATFSQRIVTISPSATHWYGLNRPARTRSSRVETMANRPAGDSLGGTLLVSGPDLDEADDEVRAIAALGGAHEVFVNPSSTVQQVLDALSHAEIAHLACHGQHRRGNPLFSRLRLADGDLTIFELERLRSVPDVVVLSACESATTDDVGGSEMLGLAIAFLSLGTRSLVAGTGLVADASLTRELMVTLHEGIHDGLSVADAWFAARQQLVASNDTTSLLRDGTFNVYGA